ncbi:MAG: succinate dehydrogenase cytochrome b558 subunit [Pirellulales bacterium]|nr:succinate dehydrogenase cytochrome b558 subunit [Planctomycetales bacterium]
MDTPAHTDSFLVRHEFLIRRLHSLSGLIPVGAYMCVHLLVNATILDSASTFQSQVNRIHSLGKLLPVVEWTFIFIPILFHAIVGVVIVRSGLPNSGNYPYAKNIRYTLQRVTGMIAFVFILWHVLHMHWMGGPLGGGQFNPHHAASSAGTALSQSSVLIPLAYAVGILSCVYHLANGLWTMGITWGVWTSAAAQRRANYVCIVFGLLLGAVGLSALGGFATMDEQQIEADRQIENRMEEAQRFVLGETDEADAEEAEQEEDAESEAGDDKSAAADASADETVAQLSN